MRRVLVPLAVLVCLAFLLLGLSSCGSNEERANALYVSAKVAEDNCSYEAALSHYEELVTSYPETQAAVQTADRGVVKDLKKRLYPPYGVRPDPEEYPQDTEVAMLRSVIKCLRAEDYEYFVVKLAWPGEPDDEREYQRYLESLRAEHSGLMLQQLIVEIEWILSESPEPETDQYGTRTYKHDTFMAQVSQEHDGAFMLKRFGGAE